MKTLMELFESRINRLCAMIFSCALTLGGYNLISWSKLTPSDWAMWVAAIGTVGTLIGTIWLATSADRRREHDERALAAVTASGLQLRITAILDLVLEIKEVLESEDLSIGGRYRRMATDLAEAALWSDEEVLRLMVLPRNVAVELAAVRDEIRHCVTLLRSGNPRGLLSLGRSLVMEADTVGRLTSVAASLDLAATECRRYTLRSIHIEF